MASGQCNCGAVAFEVRAEIAEVFICHCSICRKATGTNGIAVVVASKDDFHWLRGEAQISRWKKPKHDWQASFCRVCGSPLPDANDAQHMYIPAGLINESGEKLRVTRHIWVDSKAVWDEIGDAGEQHQEAFEKR